jgi:hypothetical protein
MHSVSHKINEIRSNKLVCRNEYRIRRDRATIPTSLHTYMPLKYEHIYLEAYLEQLVAFLQVADGARGQDECKEDDDGEHQQWHLPRSRLAFEGNHTAAHFL